MKFKKLKIFKNKTGVLIPISLKKNIPLRTKRIFIIHGKKNIFRGNHAHYKCYQFLVPLSGSMIVYYEYKKRKNVKTLSFNLNNRKVFAKCLGFFAKIYCHIKDFAICYSN